MQPSAELAIILFITGVIILCLELFIPSAGMLFIMSSCCLIGSVVVAFLHDQTVGYVFLGLLLLLLLIGPYIGFQLWKRSPIGRRMFLIVPTPNEAGGSGDKPSLTSSSGLNYASLVGTVGRTLTPLRPAGIVDFEGRRVDSVTEGVMLDRGALVRVVEVEGNRVVVREVSEGAIRPVIEDFEFSEEDLKTTDDKLADRP